MDEVIRDLRKALLSSKLLVFSGSYVEGSAKLERRYNQAEGASQTWFL
jgi:hypothetical protein